MTLAITSSPANQKSFRGMWEECKLICHSNLRTPSYPLFKSTYRVIMVSFVSSKPTNLLSFTSLSPLISYAKVMHFIREIRKVCIKSCLLQNSVDSPPAGIYYLIKNVVVPAAMQHVPLLCFQVELNPYWKWSLAWISLFSILMHTWGKKALKNHHKSSLPRPDLPSKAGVQWGRTSNFTYYKVVISQSHVLIILSGLFLKCSFLP